MHPMADLNTFIDFLYEHSRYIVGVQRVQHIDCVKHVEQSQICAICVYAMSVCVMRYKVGVLLGQT